VKAPVQLAGDVGGGGQSTINVASVQPNAAIDARFAQTRTAALNLVTA